MTDKSLPSSTEKSKVHDQMMTSLRTTGFSDITDDNQSVFCEDE
jgi:hypothetical protein